MGKRYDKEFKIEAVGLASEPGNTQAAIERDLGLGPRGHQPVETRAAQRR
jgi:transposase-like protein